MRLFSRKPKRAWFKDQDGTYYRNCSLILREMKQARGTRWFAVLSAEFDEVFHRGVVRKEHLERGDVAVEGCSFREAYPHLPGLWRLDDAA